MFTSPLKNRLNPQAKSTIFDIPNPPPTVGQKRRFVERISTYDEDIVKGIFEFPVTGFTRGTLLLPFGL